jgi:hypothetical protein
VTGARYPLRMLPRMSNPLLILLPQLVSSQARRAWNSGASHVQYGMITDFEF